MLWRDVFWNPSCSLDQLVEELQKQEDWFESTYLWIDDDFVDAATSLPSHSLERLLEALSKSSIQALKIQYAGELTLPDTCTNKSTFIQDLCKALGSNKGITILAVTPATLDEELLTSLFGSLGHIAKLELFEYLMYRTHDVPPISPAFLSILNNHPSIAELELYLPARFYPEILSVAESFPRLAKVSFGKCPDEQGDMDLTIMAAQAIGQLVARKPSLQAVEFHYLRLENDDIALQVFGPIRYSNVCRLVLKKCDLQAVEQLATSLTNSHLCKLVLDRNRFESEDQTVMFWSILASGMSSFQDMEVLECRVYHDDRTQPREIVESLATMIHKLSLCPRFKTIELDIAGYPASLDHALAECVNNCPLLSTIFMYVHDTISAPLLAEAVTPNYTIKVKLFSLVSPTPANDSDSVKHIRMINRLNWAGRKYLASDGDNQRQGVDVLGSVSDSLDCFFFHLRENPALCARNESVLEPPRKKRKTNESET